MRFNDAALNTKDPYATSKPDYQRLAWEVDLGGPIVKNKASFFVDLERRNVDEAQLVNATVLGPGYSLVPYNETIVGRPERTSVSPRLDAQLGAANTVTLRYAYTSNEQDDAGIGGFSLPSRGYDTFSKQHLVQLGETAVLGKVVNEARSSGRGRSAASSRRASTPRCRCRTRSPAAARAWASRPRRRPLRDPRPAHLDEGRALVPRGFRARGTRQGDTSRQGFNGTVTFAGTFGPELDTAGQPVLGPDGSS